MYEGAEGAEFSEMVPSELLSLCAVCGEGADRRMCLVSSAPIVIGEESSDDDLEAAPSRADGYQSLAPQSVRSPPTPFST